MHLPSVAPLLGFALLSQTALANLCETALAARPESIQINQSELYDPSSYFQKLGIKVEKVETEEIPLALYNGGFYSHKVAVIRSYYTANFITISLIPNLDMTLAQLFLLAPKIITTLPWKVT